MALRCSTSGGSCPVSSEAIQQFWIFDSSTLLRACPEFIDGHALDFGLRKTKTRKLMNEKSWIRILIFFSDNLKCQPNLSSGLGVFRRLMGYTIGPHYSEQDLKGDQGKASLFFAAVSTASRSDGVKL